MTAFVKREIYSRATWATTRPGPALKKNGNVPIFLVYSEKEGLIKALEERKKAKTEKNSQKDCC
jgi:hypothetical protein